MRCATCSTRGCAAVAVAWVPDRRWSATRGSRSRSWSSGSVHRRRARGVREGRALRPWHRTACAGAASCGSPRPATPRPRGHRKQALAGSGTVSSAGSPAWSVESVESRHSGAARAPQRSRRRRFVSRTYRHHRGSRQSRRHRYRYYRIDPFRGAAPGRADQRTRRTGCAPRRRAVRAPGPSDQGAYRPEGCRIVLWLGSSVTYCHALSGRVSPALRRDSRRSSAKAAPNRPKKRSETRCRARQCRRIHR